MMDMKRRKPTVKLTAWLTAIAMVFCMLPMNLWEAEAATTLKNPGVTISSDGTSTSTWDCVWFGSYPQSGYEPNEVPAEPVQGKTYTDTDGTRYMYLSKAYTGSYGSEFEYFKIEPIKWRVLSIDGNDAFLLADKNLDGQPYSEEYGNVTWETCTLRSWLNDEFMDTAFTALEQNAIKITTVANDDNPYYDTEGGNDTQDKVYLISIEEAINTSYGFNNDDRYKYDEARRTKNTEYAEEQGAWTVSSSENYSNGYWWLRSPGGYSSSAANVDNRGQYDDYGHSVNNRDIAVRPALHLDLSSDVWSYAGTVSSDGMVDEQEPSTGNENVSAIVGTLKSVDSLRFTVKIDNMEYEVSDDFEMDSAVEMFLNHHDKKVVVLLKNNKIISLDAIEDIVYPHLAVTVDVEDLKYENGKIGVKEFLGKVIIDCAVSAPYKSEYFNGIENEELIAVFIDNLRLETQYGLYLKKGGLFELNETDIVAELNTSLKAGEIFEYEFDVFVEKDFIPDSISDNIQIKVSSTVNGQEYTGRINIPIGNLDLQREQEEAKKAARELSIAVDKAQEELNGINLAIDESLLQEYFTGAQIDDINKCINIWIGSIVSAASVIHEDQKGVVESLLNKTGLTSGAIMSAVLNKMGVNENVLTQVSKTDATTTIEGVGKNGEKIKVYFSVNLGFSAFYDSAPYGAFGTVDYYIIDDDKKRKPLAKGMVTYENINTFLNQLETIAESSIKSAYNETWGNDANKVAELFTGRLISKVLNKSVGTFSDNVFKLLEAPTNSHIKKVSPRCPVDVYVFDAEGKMCGSIIDNVVDSSYNSIHMYVKDNEKYFYLTEDDYSIKLVGSDNGKMQYVIEEYVDGELVRCIEYDNIPLSMGKTYYGSLPEGIYLDNVVYDLVSDTNELIRADTDSYQDNLSEKVAVQGLSLNASDISMYVSEEYQLIANVIPANATNKEVDWESEDESVIEVSDEGVVRAKGKGKTSVRVSTVDGRFVAECKILVDDESDGQGNVGVGGGGSQTGTGETTGSGGDEQPPETGESGGNSEDEQHPGNDESTGADGDNPQQGTDGSQPDAEQEDALVKKPEALDHVAVTMSGVRFYVDTKTDGTATITGIAKSSKKTITIKDTVTINDVKYKVTAIDGKVFKNCKNVTKIIIPASVKLIRKNAFAGAKKLKKIVFKGKKAITIKKGAFKDLNTKRITASFNKKMAKKEFVKAKNTLKKAGFKGKIKKTGK